MKLKKAQAWSLDLLIATLIFIVGIIVLYVYAVNYSSQSNEKLNELFYEGNLASGLLLSDKDIGILSYGKINQSKLDAFDLNTSQEKKSILGMSNNFYFVIDGLEANGVPVDYVGIINTSATEDLVQVTRLTIYKNTPIKFQMYIWE